MTDLAHLMSVALCTCNFANIIGHASYTLCYSLKEPKWKADNAAL